MSRKIIWLLSAIVFLGLGVTVYSLTHTHVPISQPADPAAPQQLHLSLPPGKRLRYHLKREIAFSGIQGAEAPIQYTLDLVFETLKNPSAPNAITLLLRGEHSPYLVAELSPQGQLKTLETSPAQSDDEQTLDLLRDALALWSFFENSDTSGPYEASINRTPQRALRFLKIKTRYLAPPMDTSKILKSKHTLTWSEELGAPAHVTGEETLALLNISPVAQVRSRYELTLSPPAESVEPIIKTALNTRTSSLALSQSHNKESPPPALAWPTWNEALNQFDKLDSLDTYSRHQLLGDLIKHVRGSTAPLRELIKLAESEIAAPNAEAFRWSVGILAAAGTDAAQAGLLELYRNAPDSVARRQDILNALTLADSKLSSDTRTFLKNEFENNPATHEGAAYALGNAINKDPSDTHSIQTLERAWAKAKTDSERAILLDAMANAGHPDFLPIFEESFSASSNASLRTKAVFATRHLPLAEVQPLITRALRDPSPNVRLGALDSIRTHQTVEPFRIVLEKCAASDPVSGVRRECATLIKSVPGGGS